MHPKQCVYQRGHRCLRQYKQQLEQWMKQQGDAGAAIDIVYDKKSK